MWDPGEELNLNLGWLHRSWTPEPEFLGTTGYAQGIRGSLLDKVLLIAYVYLFSSLYSLHYFFLSPFPDFLLSLGRRIIKAALKNISSEHAMARAS